MGAGNRQRKKARGEEGHAKRGLRSTYEVVSSEMKAKVFGSKDENDLGDDVYDLGS